MPPDEIYWHQDGLARNYYNGWQKTSNFQVTFTIKIISIVRHSHVAFFMATALDGPYVKKHFPISMADMELIICNCTITNGITTAKWTVRKRGEEYGLTPMLP